MNDRQLPAPTGPRPNGFLAVGLALALLSAGSLGCSMGSWPTAITIGPPAATPANGSFAWAAVPGASAYTLVVSLDRAGTTPVGRTGFTPTPQVAAAAIAWNEGYPVVDRPLFWTWRAYDRPDPLGMLLAVGIPREVTFQAPDQGTPSIGLQASGTLAP